MDDGEQGKALREAQDKAVPAPPGAGDGEAPRIVPNKNRRLQYAPTRRKLFDSKRRKIFLEWFSATCNVSLSARAAGVHYRTPLRHRMEDEAFREAFDRALGQGYARLEAWLLECGSADAPIDIEGDWELPAPSHLDRDSALQLLREHRRNLGGHDRKPGRRPRVASNAEIEAALVKRLAAYSRRQKALAGQAGAAAAGDDSGGGGGPPEA